MPFSFCTITSDDLTRSCPFPLGLDAADSLADFSDTIGEPRSGRPIARRTNTS